MAGSESGSGKCVGRAERGIYRGDNRTTQVDSTTQSAGVTSAPGPNKDKQYESSHCGVVPTHLITTLASSRLISTSQPPSDKLGELPPTPSLPPSDVSVGPLGLWGYNDLYFGRSPRTGKHSSHLSLLHFCKRRVWKISHVTSNSGLQCCSSKCSESTAQLCLASCYYSLYAHSHDSLTTCSLLPPFSFDSSTHPTATVSPARLPANLPDFSSRC